MSQPPNFPSLYRRYLRSVLRAVRRFGVPERHCEDIAQEVFLAVHHGLARYDRSRKFEPWLMAIAYRKAVDHLRRAECREHPSEEIDMQSTRGDEAERATALREAERLFNDLVQALEPNRRVVFLMSEVDDLNLGEIAEALGIPNGTVASRLSRAREDFAAAIERSCAVETRRVGGAHLLPIGLFSSATLLDAGRTLPEVSPEQIARMWGRIVRATSGSALAGAVAKVAVLSPTTAASAVVGALLVGAVGGGAAVHAASHHHDTVPIAPTQSESVPAVTIAPPGEAPVATAAALAMLAPAALVKVDTPPRATIDPDASERTERAILESARNALQRGDTKGALRQLERHSTQFPSGIYKEEREALRSRVLASDSGRAGGHSP